jgi:hypothetical protein
MINGYRFETINFTNGIFDESIDATYIIHLEGNGRFDLLKEQLYKFTPSKICYILFNEGYKKGNKSKYIDTPDKDLRDCNYTIFKDALEKNYNNILIHEDDFFYDEKIWMDDHIKNINNFLLENKNNEFLYYLGCVPIVLNKYKINHNKITIGFTTHAVVYSKNLVKKILDINIETINLIYDNFLCFNPLFIDKKFTYKIPICFQLHDITENSKDWLSLNYFMDRNDILNNNLLNSLNSLYFNINKIIIIDILRLNKEKNVKEFIELLYDKLSVN